MGKSMNDYMQAQARSLPGRADMAVDAGLRGFMLGVYNKMALGLVLSAALAYIAASVPPVRDLVFGTPLRFVVMFGPIALLFLSMFAMRNPSPTGANLLYWSIVSLIGIGMGAILLTYGARPDGMMDVAKAFLTTAVAFGALSLWGYTTKKDLSGFGTFLIMGLIGLVVASIVNMFLQSDAMSFIISVAGVLIFAGLTAFDTQRLKFSYYELAGDTRAMNVATTFGALSLYLNFVNLFQFLLSLMGNRE